MQLRLPGFPKRPRAKPVKRMHVIDAGDPGYVLEPGYTFIAQFECHRCGHKSDWLKQRSVTEAKKGIPCPKCNGAQQTESMSDKEGGDGQ